MKNLPARLAPTTIERKAKALFDETFFGFSVNLNTREARNGFYEFLNKVDQVLKAEKIDQKGWNKMTDCNVQISAISHARLIVVKAIAEIILDEHNYDSLKDTLKPLYESVNKLNFLDGFVIDVKNLKKIIGKVDELREFNHMNAMDYFEMKKAA